MGLLLIVRLLSAIKCCLKVFEIVRIFHFKPELNISNEYWACTAIQLYPVLMKVSLKISIDFTFENVPECHGHFKNKIVEIKELLFTAKIK